MQNLTGTTLLVMGEDVSSTLEEHGFITNGTENWTYLRRLSRQDVQRAEWCLSDIRICRNPFSAGI